MYIRTFQSSIVSKLSSPGGKHHTSLSMTDFLVSLDSEDVAVAANCKVLKDTYSNQFDDDMEMEIQQYHKSVENPLETFLDNRRNLVDTDGGCHKKER